MTVSTTGYRPHLQAWIDVALGQSEHGALQDMLHDDAVFHSPVVHTPQKGKALVFAYLSAADNMFSGNNFHYTWIFDCGDRAVLEFESIVDGIVINGVDLIEWDANGKITEFKVMIRPLKAIQTVHAAMQTMLASLQS